MRWFVIVCGLWLTACNAFAPTPTSTPIPTPTKIPPTPLPALHATILPDTETSFRQVTGRAPFTVTFAANVSGGVPPYTYAWDVNGDTQSDSAEKSPPPVVFARPSAYNVALRVTDAAGQTIDAARRIVAFAPPQPPAWRYGINAPLEQRGGAYYPNLADVERAAKAMQDAGVQAVRVHFNWDAINPTRDEFRFDEYDAIVRILRQHNLQVIGVLDYASWWASSAQDSNDWRVRLFSGPNNDVDYARYTYETVKHFQNEVQVWQIWNEPNTQDFWKPKPDAARYVALLQEAYLAAKYANPNAFVVFAGLRSNGVEGSDDANLLGDFIAKAYAAGARGYFDALAIHPYILPNGGINALREKIAAARAVMNQHGDQNIPLWLTEIGVPTDVPWWSNAPVLTEQDAASWLNLVYTKLWDLTPTIFWYEIQDRAADDPQAHFGLLRAEGSPKPAYDVLRGLTLPR